MTSEKDLSAGIVDSTPSISYDLLHSAMHSGPGINCIVRATDYHVIFANALFYAQTGISEAEIAAGFSFTGLLHNVQQERLLFQLTKITTGVDPNKAFASYKLETVEGTKHFLLYPSILDIPVHGTCYNLLLLPDQSKWNLPFISFDTRELFLEQFSSEDFGTFEWIVGVDRSYWSSGIYKIYEVDENFTEITRAFARKFVHPADAERLTNETTKAMQENSVLNTEFRIYTACNNLKVIHSIAHCVYNEKGELIKFVGTLRDVTESRKIEESLKNKVDELNNSNKGLEEFAYVASHDMQEPLRKITTFSSRLLEKYGEQLEEEGKMYLTRMVASAENMRTLINDLLDFSRISNTSQPFETVDLNGILKNVQNDLELKIEETETTIVAEHLPSIKAIRSQMQQLFNNIISNAIKFHQPDTAPIIKLSVSQLAPEEQVQRMLAEGSYCKIEIADNGIGFEQEFAQRIFQVFQRLHGKSEYPGTGIGLAICKKIVEHHKGTLYAEGRPGEGATFTIILPLTNN